MTEGQKTIAKGAVAFGSGIFLTSHFLGHEGWGIALVLGLGSGLGYGLVLRYLHSHRDCESASAAIGSCGIRCVGFVDMDACLSPQLELLPDRDHRGQSVNAELSRSSAGDQ